MKASEARDISNGVNVKVSMYQIRLAILRASRNGDTFIYIHETPSEKVKSLLETDGYKIEDVSDHARETKSMYKISW